MFKKKTEEYFDELIDAAMELGVKKMSRYGTSWTCYRPGSLMARMLNKGKRIVSIQITKENKVGEKISGEFREIMTYGTLLCMMLENKVPLFTQLKPEEVTEYRQNTFQKAKELMIKKNHDYGEAWKDMSQKEIVDEINTKISRMKAEWEVDETPSFDNIYDVMNYCAFALIHIDAGNHEDM